MTFMVFVHEKHEQFAEVSINIVGAKKRKQLLRQRAAI